MADEVTGSSTASSGHASPKSPPGECEQPINALIRPMSNYKELNVIGTGAYGTVYKARDLLNPNNVVALKKVRIPKSQDGVPLSTLREIALLKQLENFQHPNVVKLLDVCHGPLNPTHLILYLVFEHCEQDLASYIENSRPNGIAPEKIWSMSKEILSGIDFLHSHRIIHRDLKPQNLLVTSSGNIKLADFGLAKTYDSEMKLTTVVVTLWYRPPEVLLGLAYHSAVDIWSAGAVLYELHSLQTLFPGHSEADQLDKIFSVIGRPDAKSWPANTLPRENFRAYLPRDLSKKCPNIDPRAKELIQRMLCFDPTDRPMAADCFNDPYFENGFIPISQ